MTASHKADCPAEESSYPSQPANQPARQAETRDKPVAVNKRTLLFHPRQFEEPAHLPFTACIIFASVKNFEVLFFARRSEAHTHTNQHYRVTNTYTQQTASRTREPGVPRHNKVKCMALTGNPDRVPGSEDVGADTEDVTLRWCKRSLLKVYRVGFTKTHISVPC
ncbi:hypothetical protein ElyMa_006253800 [Elysia marginata]|uniref:Uncharacterized protein n=1 Tax=Elysia marginata TaxID=1093978 RepID=A0AAV4H8T4_9GAST|nr:hypothetical protein ElyMa_006253800 [Elysia marginata]